MKSAMTPNWQVTARPSAQQQAATVTVEPGSTATIQLEANPPDDVPAGTYPIAVRATGAGTTVETEIEVEVTGTVRMAFATANERLDVDGSAGDVTSVPLVVRNDGSAPLQGVTFSATPPSGWEVTFEPERLEVVPPGQAAAVTARIRPDGDAVAGDYAVTLRSSGSGQNGSLDLRFAVETSGWWGFVGLAIIVYFTLISLVLFGNARYHFPIMPWVIIYSGIGGEILLAGRRAIRTEDGEEPDG